MQFLRSTLKLRCSLNLDLRSTGAVVIKSRFKERLSFKVDLKNCTGLKVVPRELVTLMPWDPRDFWSCLVMVGW